MTDTEQPHSFTQPPPQIHYRGVPANLPQAKINRILSNRASAQKSRDKKKKEATDMKDRIGDLEKENQKLKATVAALENELKAYRASDASMSLNLNMIPVAKKLRLTPSPPPSPSSVSSTISSPPSNISSPSSPPPSPESDDTDLCTSSGDEAITGSRKRKAIIVPTSSKVNKSVPLPRLLPVDIVPTPTINNLNNNNNNTNVTQISDMISQTSVDSETDQDEKEALKSTTSEPAALTFNSLQLEVLLRILFYLWSGLTLFGAPNQFQKSNSSNNNNRSSNPKQAAVLTKIMSAPSLLPLQKQRLICTVLLILQLSRMTNYSHPKEPPSRCNSSSSSFLNLTNHSSRNHTQLVSCKSS